MYKYYVYITPPKPHLQQNIVNFRARRKYLVIFIYVMKKTIYFSPSNKIFFSINNRARIFILMKRILYTLSVKYTAMAVRPLRNI